jgi:hypothetical protein
MTRLCELTAAAPRAVDETAQTIRGVAVLGRLSRNKRTYSDRALGDVAKLADGIKVYTNHSVTRPRNVLDTVGILRDAHVDGERVRADLVVVNPNHWGLVAGAARRAPNALGLSVDVDAAVTRKNGRATVESVANLRSVDVVSSPAATRTLFESADDEEGGFMSESGSLHDLYEAFTALPDDSATRYGKSSDRPAPQRECGERDDDDAVASLREVWS